MDEVLELQQQFSGARQCEEGGTTFYFIPSLRMPSGCTPQQTDVLLCSTPRDGYPSRLYFAEHVQGPINQNWNGSSYYILGREWYAFSWSDIQGLRLTELVLAYMRALLP
jgi:hypothetical protein